MELSAGVETISTRCLRPINAQCPAIETAAKCVATHGLIVSTLVSDLCIFLILKLKGQYPQFLWSILLVGKLLQIFGFFLLPALAMH